MGFFMNNMENFSSAGKQFSHIAMEQCDTVGGFIKEDVGFSVFRQKQKIWSMNRLIPTNYKKWHTNLLVMDL